MRFESVGPHISSSSDLPGIMTFTSDDLAVVMEASAKAEQAGRPHAQSVGVCSLALDVHGRERERLRSGRAAAVSALSDARLR